MCIAIYKPSGKTVSKAVLKTCFENNSDGAGFAYINTDYYGKTKLKTHKFMEFEPFWVKYEKYTRLMPESPFLIHFRIKTHGKRDIANCHPFMINQETAFIHNGIIIGVGSDPEMSDTRLFNKCILQELGTGWYNNKAIVKLIADFIGMSKLVILNVNGDVAIINEAKGVWHEGIWWSNESFKDRKTYQSQYSYSGTSKHYFPDDKSWKDTKKADTKKVEKEKKPNDKVVRINKKAPITLSSWSSCECCNRSFPLRVLKVYKVETDYMCFCPQCIEGEVENGFLSPKDNVPIVTYVEKLNKVRNADDELKMFGDAMGAFETDGFVEDYTGMYM